MDIQKIISPEPNEDKNAKNSIDDSAQACEKETTVDKQKNLKKHRILNVCTLIFTAILTIVALATFFIALFNNDYAYPAYYIASTYVLCMLLAAPTLKVFLDKCTCRVLKKLTIIGLVAIFATIAILVVVVSLTFALPCIFGFCTGS